MFRFGYGPDFFWVLIPLLGTIVWIALLVVLVWALLRWLTTKNIPVIGYHPTPTIPALRIRDTPSAVCPRRNR
jgi:hypothetical protein